MSRVIPRIADRMNLLAPNTQWVCRDQDYDQLEMLDGAPKPAAVDLEAITEAELDAERNAQQTALDDAVTTLLNNSDVIRDSMDGVTQARTALDSVIPIDNTSTATIINTIAQRQAAVMFLAANALRAVMHLEKSGELPDEIVDTFIK